MIGNEGEGSAGLVPAIERAALWAWPPRETRHLHGWLLRGGGPLDPKRVNSARTLAFDAPGDRLGAAIGEVEAWYAARGRPACFQLADRHHAPEGLDDALEARGYARLGAAAVMTADVAALPPAGGEVGPGIELLHRPAQGVLEAMAEPYWNDAQRRGRAALIARIRRPHRLALATVAGVPAAGGLVVADGELAGLFALHTRTPYRRRGLARRLVAAMTAWARAQGAVRLYLQVEEENAPAQGLYAGFGFARSYGYWYRMLNER